MRKVIDILYYPDIFQAGDKGAYQFQADRILADRLQQNIDLSRNDLISEFISYSYLRLNKHVTSTLVKRLPKSMKEELQKDFGHREYITETTFRTNNTFT